MLFHLDQTMIFGNVKKSHCNEIIILKKLNHHTFQYDYHLKSSLFRFFIASTAKNYNFYPT